MTNELQELLDFRKDHLGWPIPSGLLSRYDVQSATLALKERKRQIEEADKNPLIHGFVPKIWETVDRNIADLRAVFPKGVIKICIFGGNRCLRGDTEIYDPVAKIKRRVDEITEPFYVYSWDGKEVVVAEASVPFQKGRGKMLRVRLSNGVSFCAAESHRVYTSQGWRDLSQLRQGTSLFLPRSSLDISRLAHVVDAGRYVRTREGFQDDYRFSDRLYDARLRLDAEIGLVDLPSQVGVPTRTSLFDSTRHWLWRHVDHLQTDTLDDWDRIPSRIPAWLRSGLQSIQDVLRRIAGRCAGILYRVSCRPYRSTSALFSGQESKLDSERSFLGFDLPESMLGFDLSDNKSRCSEAYITSIESVGTDVKWDFSVPAYNNYILGGVIHHNSSKTRYAANYLNKALISKAGARWWCCDSTEAQSRANQMRLIWEQFPPQWKNLERDSLIDIRYNVADGFPKNMFVCPNKSECHFKFYSMDLEGLPGGEFDGIWADELIPLPWVESLTYRLANRNGIFLITFTPEFGWNETFGHFYEGAQTIEDTEALLLPYLDKKGRTTGYERVPRVMQCLDPMARIIFFHTQDNPFGNPAGIIQEEKAKGNNRDSIKIRLYGICTKAHKVAFPMFNRKTHVITEEQFNRIVEEHPKGVRYHLVDPCDGRNWFMGWIFCPRSDWWTIYREWPSYGQTAAYIKGIGMLGPWAVSGAAADGVKGPGQDTLGFSLERYKEEIEDKETCEGVPEEIFARYIDSRYATNPKTQRETVTTLHEQCAEVGMDFLCMVAESKILGAKDGSVDMINSALFYDIETEIGKWSKNLGRLNQPKLQVVETCPNTIWALEHWTGEDGQRGACKDPIDVIRGAFLSRVNFVDEKLNVFVGGGIPR